MENLEIQEKVKDIFLDLSENYLVYDVQPDQFITDILVMNDPTFQTRWREFEKQNQSYKPTLDEGYMIGTGDDVLIKKYILFYKFLGHENISVDSFNRISNDYQTKFKSLTDRPTFLNEGESDLE